MKGSGFICSKLLVGVEYSVLFLFWCCYAFYISWKYFKSGNTVNTKYLNRIPNPEYLTGANVKFIVLKQNCRNFIVTLRNATYFKRDSEIC